MNGTCMDLDIFLKQKKKHKSKSKTSTLDQNFDYLPTKEYGKLVKMSPHHVRLNCLSGNIEGAVKIGRQWRIPVKKSTSI